ncbi:hypothetical protein FDF36_20895 [Bacteroides fragilis]|nr:hypothetical protein [Bacteroides fragilis]
MNNKCFKCKRLVICTQEPNNLKKALTMLMEHTGSDSVNLLPKLK